MKQLYNKFLTFGKSLENRIAFYPTVLAFSGFLFATFMIYLENLGISGYLVEHAPTLVVNNGDTALTILSSLISGLFSVVVFSFSMVMLLLSQASNNYSPRLLPGLISNKRHQIILGIYFATIIYCIFILFIIKPTGDKYQIPGFSVLLGIIFTVFCLYAFIFFIHNISQSIQISNILERIYSQAIKRLDLLIDMEDDIPTHFDDSNWHNYNSPKSGYLQNISVSNILDFCEKGNFKIHIIPVKGMFVRTNNPLFRCSQEIPEKLKKEIISNFYFAQGELIDSNYVFAFKQITEVIVKAMSPGINDPGTAINGIDYLTELFARRMQKEDHNYVKRENTYYLKLNTVNFSELLYQCMASIRTYCKQDIILVQKFLLMFQFLKEQQEYSAYKEVIDREMNNFLIDAKKAIDNEEDLRIIDIFAQKYQLSS